MPLILNNYKSTWNIPNKSINRQTIRKSVKTKKISQKDKNFLKQLGFKVLV